MCKSGPPADGPNLHVSFYPGRRPHLACNVLSGPPAHGTMLQKIYIRTPADGSQRVNNVGKAELDRLTLSALSLPFSSDFDCSI